MSRTPTDSRTWPVILHRIIRGLVRAGRNWPGMWRLRHRALDYERVRFPEGVIEAALDDGARLWVRPNDPIGRAIFYDGKWEPEVFDHFRTQLRPGDTVLDIGANIGQFTVAAAMAVGDTGRVYAVEAGGSALELLRKNVAGNRLNNVTPIHVAAWDSDTQLHLGGVREDMLGWGKVQETPASGTETVPARRLDKLLAEHGCKHVDIVKIDVEGAELRALRGMSGLLEGHLPRVIYCEVANNHDCYGATAQELVDFFLDRGYVGSLLEQNGLLPFDSSILHRTVNVTVVFLRQETKRV